MKKIIAMGCLTLLAFSANANDKLPSHATTEPAKHGEYLKSLEYSFSRDNTTTKDDVLICLADHIQNNGQPIIKLDTDKTVIAMGSVRGPAGFLGVVPVIRYDLKVSMRDDKIDMSLYNIVRAMDDEFGNDPETKYSKIGTWKNSGIYKIIPVIDAIPNKINQCIASA